LFVGAAWASGQTSFEVTPLVGGRFGGTISLQQEGQANRLATLDNSVIFGVGAGFRFDGNDCESCSVVGFRWMRQNTHLGFKEDSPSAVPFRPAVTLDHFLGDFTQEFPINGQERVKPFVTASLGAVRMSTPAESRTRLELGIGGGVNMFLKPRWGLRFQVEYLPILMNAEVQKVVCSGGCVIALSGGVMNQLVVSVGPIFRLK
jgi:hypothetical protein